MKKIIVAFALTAGLSTAVFAGSTGTTGLQTPQGSGAGTAFGDYVSDNTALDTFYRYFVEVPAGLGQLNIDIFDPDCGIGGAGEATAGRDRSRTTAYSAQYTLINPNGAARNTIFLTGDAANPAGSDGAWTNLYTSTGDTVLDTFASSVYNRNDGLMNWATNWIETNDDNNAAAGFIQITGGQLRIRDNGDANPSTIEREANLTGFTTATFTFGFSTANVAPTDQMRVQVSNNGGTTWTTLETFTGAFGASTRSYNINAFIAANTRIRFIEVGGYTGTDSFLVDNLQIKDSAITAGHWEVRANMSSAVTAGDGINAFGLRANDGTVGGGGTELNIYADSFLAIGQNPPNAGTLTRNYVFYPYITSGCTCSHNDFDYDSNSGTVGSATYKSRTAAFTQTFASAALSVNDTWARNTISGWTNDNNSDDYGIWELDESISSYLVAGTPNGNYSCVYDANFQAAANPPTSNPQANAFRIYFANDAGTAPSKPYLEQDLTQRFFGTLGVGVTGRYTVTVRVENPAAQAITFSAARLVTANIPGTRVLYGGNAQVSQGSVTAQPAVNGSGNITWNPGTLAAGATAILSYDVLITPTAAGQRNPAVGTPASGNGTRATWLDETGNANQARAIYTFGPLCEIAATQGLLTELLVSSFDVSVHGSSSIVEWTTASEAGTIGFNIYRLGTDGARERVNRNLLLAGAASGNRYRLLDTANANERPQYVLEELTASGKRNQYGPYVANGVSSNDPMPAGGFERKARRDLHEAARMVTAQSFMAPSLIEPAAAKKSNAVAVMAGVRQTGIIRVTAATIAANLGTNQPQVMAAIRSGRVNVTDRGAEVSWIAAVDGSSLSFFGEDADSIYTNDHVYRIALEKGKAAHSANVAASAIQTTTFTATQDAELDAFPATVLPLDPESDYWFWDFVLSGDPTDGSKTFMTTVPAVASSSGAVLQIRLQGATSGVTHHAHLSLNGVALGDISWADLGANSSELGIPAAVLREGSNTLTIDGVLDVPGSVDVFYVDGFSVRYTRAARPDDGRLEMPVTPGAAITAGPFAAGALALDITNRKQPVVLNATPAGGMFSFVVPPGTRTLYFADATTFAAPSFLRGSSEPSLNNRANRADYLVIAPQSVRTQADALAQLRAAEGLVTFVADLQQIYDEFSGGNSTPYAIRDFIVSTRGWQRAPRYVVLAGTGTLDYRGITVPPGLIPPLMAKTTNGLFAADSRFVDFNGDGLPDIAIGRIPISTAAELDAYVRKVDASSRATIGQLVWSADALDRGADFRRSSTLIEAPMASLPATRAYLDDVGGAAARTSLLAAWHNGASAVSWIGHGGLDRISNTAVLTADDAASLTSTTGRLPIFLAMTCTINRFELGDVQSLGAALTDAPGAGALAVWSASGLSDYSLATELEGTFTRLAANSSGARLGDLIVQSLAANKDLGETGSVYLLLGDPAVRVALPVATPGPGSPPRGRE